MRILHVLETSERPLLAREIAERLERSGIPWIKRKHVNQLLYGSLSGLVEMDGRYRWGLRAGVESNPKGPRESRKKKADPFKLTVDGAFEVLGIPRTATPDEIKKAYKRRIAEWHPDKVNTMAKELQELAEEGTALINVAYNLLRENRRV